jgi:hypothetical protein
MDKLADLAARVLRLETLVASVMAAPESVLLVSNICAPVAIAFLNEASQRTYNARFFALLDVCETIVKYTAAVAFAGALRDGALSDSAVTELFAKPPTLGKLVEAVRSAIEADDGRRWPITDVRSALRRPNGKPTPAARFILDEFVTIRNRDRGHGTQRPEGYYESVYLKNYLVVADCVQTLSYLRLPLVHIGTMNHANTAFRYGGMYLMGSAPVRTSQPIESAERVDIGATCLSDGSKDLLPLDRFLSFRYCDTCNLEHVFFAEKVESGKRHLISYTGSHRAVVPVDG